MRLPRAFVLALVALTLPGAALVAAQEEPLTAGSDGVPVPKKTKHVQPVYPQAALAEGIRGIVILDVVLDAQGRVESTSVIRSIPGLDEAAIAAARQWQYEPVKIDGKPVRVRITVPITFSLALPALERQEGVPELRQGVTPPWPAGATGSASASAEVTLEPDGRVGLARVIAGEAPFSDALLAALRTWRFAAPPEDAVLSFRVEAEFAAGRSPDANRVSLKATGLRRAELLDSPGPKATTPSATPAAEPAPAEAVAEAIGQPQPPPPTPSEPPAAPAPPPQPPAAATADAAAMGPPGAAPPAPAKPGPAPAPPPGPAPGQVTMAPGTAAAPATPPDTDQKAPPAVEVITAPPPPLPPENGVSAVRDVMLEPGVPDLARGRRPVVPPFARMAGLSGTVQVEFSVGAAGTTTVRSVNGPDLLNPAAEQMVASWVFRRSRADRAYLVATLTYVADKATAVVRPQTPPEAAAPPAVSMPPGPTPQP